MRSAQETFFPFEQWKAYGSGQGSRSSAIHTDYHAATPDIQEKKRKRWWLFHAVLKEKGLKQRLLVLYAEW